MEESHMGGKDGNNLRCVWMEAGVVGYKLCDRDLQCDQCPFDESMRWPTRSSSAHLSSPLPTGGSCEALAATSDSERVAALIRAIAPPEYPADRLYHHGHLWIKPLMESIVAIGIDRLAASMLGSLASIVLPYRHSRIIHRMPWCWLIHREGAISLYSPVHGVVIENNERLLEHPELLVQDPYGDGWIIHAQTDKGAAEGPTLFSSSEFHMRSTRDLAALQTCLLQNLRKVPSIGQTLHDGGQPAETLAAMLGSKSFFKITATLFAP